MLGKIVEWLDGKKTIIASVGTLLISGGTMCQNFSQHGVSYLLHAGSTPEFVAFSGAWTFLFLALKGEKIRTEIAAVTPPQEKPQ